MRAMRTRAALLTAAVLTLPAGLALAPAASAGTPSCFGKQATKVLTANGKTLTGTSKNDVLVATGKNDTVVGLGGDDRICVTKAGKKVDAGGGNDKVQLVSGVVKGGDGNDVITQKGAGKVTIDAGKGKDTVTLTSPAAGSSLVGGPDPDKLTVPSGKLANVSIPITSGDALNGFGQSILAPATGGPRFDLAAGPLYTDYASSSSPIRVPISAPDDYLGSGSGDQAEIAIGRLVFAPGRGPGSWSESWGDGSLVQSGVGMPPSYDTHTYLTAGLRTVTISVTDDHGATTTRAQTFDAELDPRDLTLAKQSSAGSTESFKITAPQSPTAPATSWVLVFGDGSPDLTGTGSPDGLVTAAHDYHITGKFRARVQVMYADNVRRTAALEVNLGATRTLATTFSSTSGRYGAVARTVVVGDPLYLEPVTQGYTSLSVDMGDGRGALPYDDTNFIYTAPGAYTLTLIGHRAGQPDESVSYPITAVPEPVHVQLSAPRVAPEGPITFDLTGSTPNPGRWYYYQPFAPYAKVTGVGPLPKKLTLVLSATTNYEGEQGPVRLTVYAGTGLRQLTDVTTLEYENVAQALFTAVPLGSVADTTVVSYAIGLYRGGLSADALTVLPQATPPQNARITSRTATFDGVAQTLGGGATSNPLAFPLTVGQHTIVTTTKDSAGGAARGFATASIAGPLGLTTTTPTLSIGAPGTATALNVIEGIGTNAAPSMWELDCDDDTDVVYKGFGLIPTSVPCSYTANGDYTMEIDVFDDHFQIKELRIPVHVGP